MWSMGLSQSYKWTLTDVVDGAVTELQVDTYWCGRWGCHRATSGHLLMWSMGLSQSYKWTLTDVVDGAVTELQVDTYWCGRWGCHRTTSGHLLMWSMGLSQTYKWTLTDVVDGTGTELAKELLCPESLQVVDEVGPQVQHIVARVAVSLLHNHSLATKERYLNGNPQSTWPSTNDQHLQQGYNTQSTRPTPMISLSLHSKHQ